MNQLTQAEYIALFYRLTIEGFSKVTGKNMSDLGSNVSRLLVDMSPEERKSLATESLADLSKFHQVFQSMIEANE